MSDTTFTLHPQLEKDSVWITDLTLCSVRLINDNNYPWLILVPRRNNATEAYKLSREDQNQLSIESELVCKTMEALFMPDKMDIAAIGNVVPQLHIHHVARYDNDAAWPDPVWSYAEANTYHETTLEQEVTNIRNSLLKNATAAAPNNNAAPNTAPAETAPKLAEEIT